MIVNVYLFKCSLSTQTGSVQRSHLKRLTLPLITRREEGSGIDSGTLIPFFKKYRKHTIRPY